MRHRSRPGLRANLGLPAIMACSVLFTAPASAEPLATAGIGVQSCAKLAKDMNPAEGFNNMTNALVYYWMQGYMSAANMALLEGDNEYVDLSLMDEKNLLPKIHEFCTKNPTSLYPTRANAWPPSDRPFTRRAITWSFAPFRSTGTGRSHPS